MSYTATKFGCVKYLSPKLGVMCVYTFCYNFIYARCLLTRDTNMCACFEDGVDESSLILWSVTGFLSKAYLKTNNSVFTYIRMDKTGDEYSSEVKFLVQVLPPPLLCFNHYLCCIVSDAVWLLSVI